MKQRLPVIVEFETEQNPGTIDHLQQVIKGTFPVKGFPCEMEDGVLIVKVKI